jgi:hypothetical protein
MHLSATPFQIIVVSMKIRHIIEVSIPRYEVGKIPHNARQHSTELKVTAGIMNPSIVELYLAAITAWFVLLTSVYTHHNYQHCWLQQGLWKV